VGARGPLPSSTDRKRDESKRTVEQVVLGQAPASTSAPKFTRKAWRELTIATREWWTDLLESPQASQFVRTDWRRLKMVVLPLVDRYNRELEAAEPDPALLVALAREIRQHEREFGLTPDARARMRWVMQDPAKSSSSEAGEEGGKPKRPREVRTDPRLSLVKGK
jgi:hypothetical protein